MTPREELERAARAVVTDGNAERHVSLHEVSEFVLVSRSVFDDLERIVLSTPAAPSATEAKCRANYCDGHGYTGGFSPDPEGVDNITPCPCCRPEEYARCFPGATPSPTAPDAAGGVVDPRSVSNFVWEEVRKSIERQEPGHTTHPPLDAVEVAGKVFSVVARMVRQEYGWKLNELAFNEKLVKAVKEVL